MIPFKLRLPASCPVLFCLLLVLVPSPLCAAPEAGPAKPVENASVQSGRGKDGDAAGKSAAPGAEKRDEGAASEAAAVALPVTSEPVQVFGWREDVLIDAMKEKLLAKLDTGALTSSIHAEEQELFERDGRKWVRFIVVDTRREKPLRVRLEAPLVRVARIKEPNGPSEVREVVRLSFRIGDRRMSGEFTLNNRNNMLAPVLIGRSVLKDLGWVDSGRTHLADQKLFR